MIMGHATSNLTNAQLFRIIQSIGDFQQAQSALTFLLGECDHTAKYTSVELRKFLCYESAAIVAFARPFEVSHGRVVLGLRAVGVRLDTAEEQLKSKIVGLRRKVIAHSDDECMHFKISTLQALEDSPVALPVLLFQESLRLERAEVKDAQALLRKLLRGLTETIFVLAQSHPERLNVYKQPIN
jgi:hypothetical protein